MEGHVARHEKTIHLGIIFGKCLSIDYNLCLLPVFLAITKDRQEICIFAIFYPLIFLFLLFFFRLGPFVHVASRIRNCTHCNLSIP